MTPQEQQLLNDFLNRISATPVPARDPDADAMIRKSPLASRPDALYLLTQLALVQDISLKHAEQQIQELQQRVGAQQPAQPSASFLGGPWGQAAGAPQQSPTQPRYAAPPSAPGFLHSALTTASGVVAGEVAFSALRSLFGGFGGFGGGGITGGSSGFLSGSPGSETVINNYYGDDNNTGAGDDGSADPASDDGGSDFSDNGGDFST